MIYQCFLQYPVYSLFHITQFEDSECQTIKIVLKNQNQDLLCKLDLINVKIAINLFKKQVKNAWIIKRNTKKPF